MKAVCQRIVNRGLSTTTCSPALQSTLHSGFYNSEQVQLQESVRKLVEEEINPHWQEWQQNLSHPSHTVMKKFGEAGLLGIHKPTEYGGQGLSYKYHAAFLEALGHSKRYYKTNGKIHSYNQLMFLCFEVLVCQRL